MTTEQTPVDQTIATDLMTLYNKHNDPKYRAGLCSLADLYGETEHFPLMVQAAVDYDTTPEYVPQQTTRNE